MRQKDKSRLDASLGSLQRLADSVDQALASFGAAEDYLRHWRTSRLPQAIESLALAAASADSLRGALQGAGDVDRLPPSLRTGLKRVNNAAGRVIALHRAAQSFHAGLANLRRAEMAEYDASGGVCNPPEPVSVQHNLETRG